MRSETADLWAEQDQHQGDRWRLFATIAKAVRVETMIYPGSYVDLAPSFVFPSVTYLDTDKRAPGFFADTKGVLEIIADHDGPGPSLGAMTGGFSSRPVTPMFQA